MSNFHDIAINAAIEAGAEILRIYNYADFQVTKKEDLSPLTLADRIAHNIIVSHLYETKLPILSEEGQGISYEERQHWNAFWLVDPLDGTREFIKRNGEFTVNIALIEKGTPIFGVVYAPELNDLYIGIVGEASWLIHKPDEGLNMERVRADGMRISEIGGRRSEVGGRKSEVGGRNLYRVVASRSHLNEETEKYLDNLKLKKGELEIVSKGSSLKLCMVASGEADEYPRLGPTMEWDVAAAHAVVNGAGKKVYRYNEEGAGSPVEVMSLEELKYNKEVLLNPYFLVI